MTEPTVDPLAATDGYGNPGTVVSGELIEAAWGNAVRDHVIRVFPDTTALSGWAAPNGAVAQAPVGTLFIRANGVWVPYGERLIGSVSTAVDSGPYQQDVWSDIPGLSISYNAVAGRTYLATLFIHSAMQINGTGSPTVGIADFNNQILNTAHFSGADNESQSLTTIAIFQPTGGQVVKARMMQDSGGQAMIAATQAGGRSWLTLQIVNTPIV